MEFSTAFPPMRLSIPGSAGTDENGSLLRPVLTADRSSCLPQAKI